MIICELAVAAVHTYYVIAGNTAILVHNCGEGGPSAEPVPDPLPQRKPSGAPDRTSAVYVNVRDASGTLTTVASRPGFHAEDVAQQLVPGGQMSRPFGWRMNPEVGRPDRRLYRLPDKVSAVDVPARDDRSAGRLVGRVNR